MGSRPAPSNAGGVYHEPDAGLVIGLSVVAFAGALGFALMGLLTKDGELPPTGPGVIEGKVGPDPTVVPAFGDVPLLYGRVQVSAVTRGSQGKRYRRVFEESFGDPVIRVESSRGEASVKLPEFDHATWKHPRYRVVNPKSLEGTALADRVTNWEAMDRLHFNVVIYGVAPGDHVVVELQPDGSSARRLWGRSRSTITEHEEQFAATWRGRLFTISAVFATAALALIALGFVVSRRRRRARPREDDALACVAHAVNHGASYEVEYRGRKVDATCTFNRSGPGLIIFCWQTALATRLAWGHRTGTGVATDHEFDIKREPGDEFGYPDLDVAMADAAWALPALRDPTVQQAVATLFNPQLHGSQQVVLALLPGACFLTLGSPDHGRIERSVAGKILDAADSLLGALEALPPPRQAFEPPASNASPTIRRRLPGSRY